MIQDPEVSNRIDTRRKSEIDGLLTRGGRPANKNKTETSEDLSEVTTR